MTKVKMIETILSSHFSRYPSMQIQDLYKFLHQAAMGSGHAVSDIESAWNWLGRELADMPAVSISKFPAAEMADFFRSMEDNNYPAAHHSREYEQLYRPAYRVVALAFYPRIWLQSFHQKTAHLAALFTQHAIRNTNPYAQ